MDHGEPPSSGLYLHSSSSARAPTPPPPNERGDEWREEDLVLSSDSFVLDKDVSLPIKVFLAEHFYVGDSEEEEHPIGAGTGDTFSMVMLVNYCDSRMPQLVTKVAASQSPSHFDSAR